MSFSAGKLERQVRAEQESFGLVSVSFRSWPI